METRCGAVGVASFLSIDSLSHRIFGQVGAVVEVRNQDGTYQEATINKLTDASVYTVVFDDGDEKTLRRSSLCLKGARHFAESEVSLLAGGSPPPPPPDVYEAYGGLVSMWLRAAASRLTGSGMFRLSDAREARTKPSKAALSLVLVS
uniref:Tudor domain-containing protein n=1 Tax=Paramormyrops kingsleyae TaxID=1676925 RepID=A0A3B3QRD0_9TELE